VRAEGSIDSRRHGSAVLSERVENLSLNHPPSSAAADKPAELQSLADIARQLGDLSRKMDTLTQTVLYMEKRLCLVEEQVKLISK
jgi:hypothetical protein